jgi:hypothetical protein
MAFMGYKAVGFVCNGLVESCKGFAVVCNGFVESYKAVAG